MAKVAERRPASSAAPRLDDLAEEAARSRQAKDVEELSEEEALALALEAQREVRARRRAKKR